MTQSNPFEFKEAGELFAHSEHINLINSHIAANPVQGAQCVSLVGPRHIGKTEVLKHIEQQRFPTESVRHNNLVHVLFLDCAEMPKNRVQAFRYIGARLYHHAQNVWKLTLRGGAYNSQERLDASEILTVRNAFEDILNGIEADHGHYVVLLLDHFDVLLQLFTADDLQFLRDRFSTPKHGLVVSTLYPIRELAPKSIPSAFDNIFDQRRVKPYRIEVADDYLKRGNLTYSEIQVILKQVGGHPRLLQLYASQVWEMKQTGMLIQECQSEIEQNLKATFNRIFLDLWSDIPEEMKLSLYRFASGETEQPVSVDIQQALETNYGVLYLGYHGTRQVIGELFKDFVIVQTAELNRLLRTDFYESGLKMLQKVKAQTYVDTDPAYYYRQGFKNFFSSKPDYRQVNQMLGKTVAGLMDVLVLRAEQRTPRDPFPDDDFSDKLSFVKKAFDLGDSFTILFEDLWSLLSEEISRTNFYEMQFRFYMVSGAIQYLLNVDLQTTSDESLNQDYDELEVKAVTNHSRIVKARHKNLSHLVAIKQMFTSLEAGTGREQRRRELLRQGQILAGLRHPNICRVYDTIDDPIGVVMEWIEGRSLRERLDLGDIFSIAETIQIGIKISEALRYVHDQGVIHRDIKPENIILRIDGEPVLIDFDVARAVGQFTVTDPANAAYGIGTPGYMPPEQYNSKWGVVSAATDLFAFAAVLYELCTGKRAFPAGANADDYHGDLPLPEKTDTIDDEFYNLILPYMRTYSQDRPVSAQSLIEALKAYSK